MKKLIAASALGLAMVAGTASADKMLLADEQLDNVNAGLALSISGASAGASGAFFSATATNTTTTATSGVLIVGGLVFTPSTSTATSFSASAAL